MSNSEKYLNSKSRQTKKEWKNVKGLIVSPESVKYRTTIKQ